MYIKDLNESFSQIFFDENEHEALNLKLKIMESLSVYQDGYRFTPQYRAGIWDGKVHFYKITPEGLIIPKGLVQSILNKYKKFITKEYKPISTVEKVSYEEIKDFIKTLNIPFEPRDYQIEAVVKCLNEPRKIALMATSSGKSLTIYILMRWFMSKGLKGVLIVPNVGLVEQMKSDFISYGFDDFDNYAHIIYAGKEKHFNKPITISTWQSTIKNLELFKSIDYIIIDEAHGAKSDVLQKILEKSENCVYKLGFTGTLPKEKVALFSLAATLGKSDVIITPQGLIERGLATPVEILIFYLNYSEEDKKTVRKLKSYQKEVKFLEEHKGRNTFISNLTLSLSKKVGNTLLLYNTINHGETLLKRIVKKKLKLDNPCEEIVYVQTLTKKRLASLKKKKIKVVLVQNEKAIPENLISDNEIQIIILNKSNIFFIRGDVSGEERNKIRSILENTKDGILIATFGTVSTGVNIKNLHCIIMASSTKSTIRLNQSIGRGMRLHNEKEKMILVDIVDDFSTKKKDGKVRNKNYILKHSEERVNDYLKHGYPITEKEFILN